MSEMMNSFSIFAIISEEIKTEIKIFHVFDDIEGQNVLFITSDDKVFGFGSNRFGCCGLGHNSVVNEPQIIPELCHKNIQQFFIGSTFILGLNSDKQVYGWGGNSWGQLCRRFFREDNEYLRPEIICFPFESVIQISCGSHHSLALTSEGKVYGWGDNEYGEVGCGEENGEIISNLVELKTFTKFSIRSIYCSYRRSYALTTDGLVYSWGWNQYFVLGHELEENECVFEPKMIANLRNVIDVCPSTCNTYFLTNANDLYFCGIFYDENNVITIQKTPKLLNSETKFFSLHSIPNNKKRQIIASGISGKFIYFLKFNTFREYNFCSFLEFYSKKYEMTDKTIELKNNQNFCEKNSKDISFYQTLTQTKSLKTNRVFNRFVIFGKISEEIKQKIKLFHIFDDIKGQNVLFITSDDKVFGFGSNCFGCCGLGHNSVVNEPQIIPELCHKNIQQFFIGGTHILGLNSDKHVYGWGGNRWGQLCRGFVSEDNEYLRPEIICFPFESVIQISCGRRHSLALTSEGTVYGWGGNRYGEVGCGKQFGEEITNSIEIKAFRKFSVKSIHCSYLRSYALTTDGLVYSWGYNDWCVLGHELEENECVFEPKMIVNLQNVINICPSTKNTYFLTNDNYLYFCGIFFDENNIQTFQKTPKLLNSEKKFSSLHSIFCYQFLQIISSAICEDSVYELHQNLIQKFNDKSFFDFYSTKYDLSHKTIQITSEQSFNGNDLTDLHNYITEDQINDRFEDMFEMIKFLGEGGFGKVYEVRNKKSKKEFAIKVILFRG